MPGAEKISIAYCPTVQDALGYFALEAGRIPSAGHSCEFYTLSLAELNRAALQRQFDITAISAAAYANVADDYRILGLGATIGRDFGPVLASRHYYHLDQLQFRRVGVPGISTTGALLLKWACPDAELVEVRGDNIAAAVAEGELDAGVLIQDEVLDYERHGLHLIADLGQFWSRETSLPLPLGLLAISRRFDLDQASQLHDLLSTSFRFAIDHCAESLNWASGFGRSEEAGCVEKCIAMLAADDCMRLSDDVRQALGKLLSLAKELGFSRQSIQNLEIVEGLGDSPRRRPAPLAA